TGKMERHDLETALGDVVERHESLRTIFPETLGMPRQQILDPATARFGLTIVQSSETTLGEDLAAAAGQGFDLSWEIPLRAHLFELGESEHVLLLVVHHIAGDGWSLGPLARDLAWAYAARREGKSPEWAELPVQYADYTLWQYEVMGNESDLESPIARQLAYWKETLQGLPEQLNLPTDRLRPNVSSYSGEGIPVQLKTPLHKRLVRLAQDRHTSLFMVL